MKRIVFTVTNDLATDQRMIRICTSLQNAGYQCTLVGRIRNTSLPLQERSFKQIRLNAFFDKGKLFYLIYNIRLLFFLLKYPTDIICGIDLDTLLPAFIVSKIRKKTLIYDAHEYFTEVEEISERPIIQSIWKRLERTILPKIKYSYTVCDSFAHIFKEEYGINMEVIRNATVLVPFDKKPKTEKYILYQGAVNMGRGLEEVIEAMQYINAKLIICGNGDIFDKLKHRINELKLTEKVILKGHLSPEDLKKYTQNAYIGLTLFQSKGKNNYYSLANRFFDYMHAEIPQIVINLPEYQKINTEFELGILVNLEIDEIKNAINILLSDSNYYQKLSEGAKNASLKNNWQNEEKKLIKFYSQL